MILQAPYRYLHVAKKILLLLKRFRRLLWKVAILIVEAPLVA